MTNDDSTDERPNSYWNYRLIHHNVGEPEQQWIGLHEVYYEGDEVTTWTKNAVTFVVDVDEGTAGIIETLEWALTNCRNKPRLLLSDLLEASARRLSEGEG